jgi:hypothetical protein
MPEALIPLHGTRYFARLTETEKRGLYLGFIQFKAEFFILLEGLILFAMRSLRADPKSRRLSQEEILHSQAFRWFLRKEKALPFTHGALMLRRGRPILSAVIALVRAVPLAMSLPGAKVEAYSVAYSQFLRSQHGAEDASSWVKLNWLHLLDEVHHVPFEFEIHEAVFQSLGPWGKARTILGISLFFGFLQWILISSCLLLGWRSLGGGPARRALLALATVYWAARSFPPTRRMREMMRAHAKSRRPSGGFWIWYVFR